MINSLFFVRAVIVLILLFALFILYTAYFVRKYQFIQDKKKEVLECYEDFIKLYEGDTYFSKRDYYHWEKEYESLKSIIIDYKYHIDKLIEISDRINVLNSIAKSYMNIFLLSKDYEEVIRYLNSIFQYGESQVESRNKEYIKTELEKYENFFNNQGGNTLTPQQRETIIVDEANNHVIAGSRIRNILTLVSKVGYILEKGLAKPKEILLLVDARKAKEEYEERIRKDYDVELNVHTIHSFGVQVIGESEGCKPLVSELSFDDILLQKTIEEVLQSRVKNYKFSNSLNEYFVYYLNSEENILDFNTGEEYEEYLNSVKVRTFHGERVKSFAELEIANFLYFNGVNYQYEREYFLDASSEQHRQYTPDFYLPEYGIWIEHIDIDRECNTASEVDRWEYLDSWYEKRKTHAKNFTELLETYSFEHLEDILLEKLRSQLDVRGVSFKPISEEQLFERLKGLGEFALFVNLLVKYLKLYKSNIFTIPDLRRKALEYPSSKRYLAFLDIFEIILEEHELKLVDSERIDFDDMIKKATFHIQNRNYESGFKYILIDEFQDISQSRYRLLKALIDQNHFTKTFSVGDDWRARQELISKAFFLLI